MKYPVAIALAALSLLPGLPAYSETPNAPAKRPSMTTRTEIDSLSDTELDQVIRLLKDNYLQPDALGELEQKRATVQGLLERLAPGAALIEAAAGAQSAASQFRAEILDDRIGYVRLGNISPENVAELDATLQKFMGSKIPALVLDLRATPAASDFEQTADVCRRFCPKGKILFSVKKPNIKQEQILTSKEDPKYRGILVVLVDRRNAGNAEVVAAVLRTHVNALVIGQQTRGEAAEFSEFPLSNGKLLRVAVAEVSLPDRTPVFPGGVKPDLAVDVPEEATEKVLQQELEKGVSQFVFEKERPRMNEAALVAGTNPEFDAAQSALKARGEKTPATLRDVVLQRAVDFITTIAIYEHKAEKK
jgi:hypothetical protein